MRPNGMDQIDEYNIELVGTWGYLSHTSFDHLARLLTHLFFTSGTVLYLSIKYT